MPENAEGQEKTEQPTSKRLNKARSDGQVAKSQEVNFVTGLMAALLYLALNGPSMIKSIGLMMARFLENAYAIEINTTSIVKIQADILSDILRLVSPFMLILVVVAVLSNVSQVGFLLTSKPFKPNLNKLNPVSGLKRLFSPRKLVEAIKGVLKIIIIASVPYIILRAEIDNLPLIMDMSTWGIMSYMGKVILIIVFYASLVLLILAVIDYIYQRWNHMKDLKMTKQEVKDEFKQAEGDPKVKARIKQLQLKMALQRMMEAVPKSDVVIANPVHLAVALRYDRSMMDAPKVVAKGARLIAEKIKKIARENNVTVIENKPLAKSLYELVEVGDTVPEALYKAVAEVLAFVYRRNNRSQAAGY